MVPPFGQVRSPGTNVNVSMWVEVPSIPLDELDLSDSSGLKRPSIVVDTVSSNNFARASWVVTREKRDLVEQGLLGGTGTQISELWVSLLEVEESAN